MRQPYNVLIIPYRVKNNLIEYLIAKRSDIEIWQAISGGGESRESIIDSAKRELKEETGLTGEHWIQLDSICMIPKIMFKDHEHWQEHPHVIPEYSFGVRVRSEPLISYEHTEFKWCTEKEAMELLKYDSNKTALWELNRRLIS